MDRRVKHVRHLVELRACTTPCIHVERAELPKTHEVRCPDCACNLHLDRALMFSEHQAHDTAQITHCKVCSLWTCVYETKQLERHYTFPASTPLLTTRRTASIHIRDIQITARSTHPVCVISL
jgi:hypothetical protein